ncbi:MAG: hypothetical protein IT437_00395 [Phycisphaerales bacterium]|nr:hypothetical protein [Phycisphaerales bacterium]
MKGDQVNMNGPHPIPIPAGLSEADLLAWVEGGPLQRDVAAAVARALDADPGLARLLGSMKADRAAILALADERAPDGLADAAMAIAEPALERRMLLGMESSAPARGGTPVSIVQPSRRSVLEVIFADRVGRRFAAAAGLLLVAGGATWFVTSILTRGGLSRPPEQRIANAGVQVGVPEVEPPAAPESEEPGIELAMGPPLPPPETGGLKQASELRAAMAEAAPATPAPMATARALHLARGRRLVIRVTGTSLEQGSARMQSLAVAHARPESAWRVSGEAPPRVAALFTPRPTEWPVEVPASGPAALASRSDSTGAALPSPAAPVHMTPPPLPRCRVFTVESRLDESALDAILASLSGDGLSAAFAEATDAVPESAPGMTAAALLWWTQSPASWAPWGTIPVVIMEK